MTPRPCAPPTAVGTGCASTNSVSATRGTMARVAPFTADVCPGFRGWPIAMEKVNANTVNVFAMWGTKETRVKSVWTKKTKKIN